MTTSDESSPAAAARRLMRAQGRAVLATAMAEGGHPYASLVLVAPDGDGSPLLLISRLAQHTRNLAADPRASLFFDGTVGLAQPLEGERLTLLGLAAESADPGHRRRYLERHPEAAFYAGFKDFGVWRLAVERGHLVAGFGRIHWIEAAALLD
jgi:putative heme iron utilization protein